MTYAEQDKPRAPPEPRIPGSGDSTRGRDPHERSPDKKRSPTRDRKPGDERKS